MTRLAIATLFTSNGTWYPNANTYGFEVFLRGGGGSGATGWYDGTTTTNQQPGPGGGGGCAFTSVQTSQLPTASSNLISAFGLPKSVPVVVGSGGASPAATAAVAGSWNPGLPGGQSSIGSYCYANGGLGGGWALGATTASVLVGGASVGYNVYVGGTGGAQGSVGGSASGGYVDLFTGGGGGGCGAGYPSGSTTLGAATAGGASGLVPGGTSYPAFYQACQSGGGGAGGSSGVAASAGGFPAGGGGGGCGNAAPTATGSVGAQGANGLVLIIEYYFSVE